MAMAARLMRERCVALSVDTQYCNRCICTTLPSFMGCAQR